MGSAKQFRPVANSGVTFPVGFSAGAVYAGIKTPGPGARSSTSRYSHLIGPAVTAGIFTTNAFCAAPVVVTRERVASRQARAVIVNAGNANACTGAQGLADAREMAELAARKIDGRPDDVLVASTGVIGVPLPMDLIRSGTARSSCQGRVARSSHQAIITTDTHPERGGGRGRHRPEAAPCGSAGRPRAPA